MATYTRTDLRDAVLVELGVKDAQEATQAVDAVLADDRCQQKLELLNEAGLVPFDFDSAIPARYFVPLVHIIAETLAGPYGMADKAAYLAQNAERGMRDLYRLKAQPYFGQPSKGQYF